MKAKPVKPFLFVLAVLLAQVLSAQSQIDCLPTGQNLVKIPELVSSPDGKLHATLVVTDEQQRITFAKWLDGREPTP